MYAGEGGSIRLQGEVGDAFVDELDRLLVLVADAVVRHVTYSCGIFVEEHVDESVCRCLWRRWIVQVYELLYIEDDDLWKRTTKVCAA